MTEPKIDPRKMALQIAGLRAAETLLPGGEQVFSDPYARRFFDEAAQAQFQTAGQARESIASYNRIMPGVNGAIVARIRFMDETFRACLTDGFQQAVIIGAGYDTRAYRIPGVAEQLTVFEVDHPVTQDVKVGTIREVFGSLPDHVRYVPVVFGRDRLDQALTASGYRDDAKTLFIVEGLLMYIPPPAVDGLLAFVSKASAPGSLLVADYFRSDVIDGTSPLAEAKALKQFVEAEGSALMFGLEAGNEAAFFEARGFNRVRLVSTAECRERYFTGDSRDRTVSPMFNFLTAEVGG